MEPWVSWVTFVTLGGVVGGYYFLSSRSNIKSSNRPQTFRAEKNDSIRSRRRLRKAGADTTIDDASQLAKLEPDGPVIEAEHKPVSPTVDPDRLRQVQRAQDRDFAEAITSARSGTPPTSAKLSKRGRKSLPHSILTSSPSTASASGVDSPWLSGTEPSTVASPLAGSTDTFNDVSDMLEASAPGPSTLRLTDPVQAPRPMKSLSSTTFRPETKKQRQNRQKSEAARMLREETESARRVLLEKQRRTARIAEGRPAKNGVTQAQAPQQSVWGTSPNAGLVPMPSGAMVEPYLDTLESATTSNETLNNIAGSSSEAPSLSTSISTAASEGVLLAEGTKLPARKGEWTKDLPSEERQMEIIRRLEEESGWNTVTKKKLVRKGGSSLDEVVHSADRSAGKA